MNREACTVPFSRDDDKILRNGYSGGNFLRNHLKLLCPFTIPAIILIESLYFYIKRPIGPWFVGGRASTTRFSKRYLLSEGAFHSSKMSTFLANSILFPRKIHRSRIAIKNLVHLFKRGASVTRNLTHLWQNLFGLRKVTQKPRTVYFCCKNFASFFERTECPSTVCMSEMPLVLVITKPYLLTHF